MNYFELFDIPVTLKVDKAVLYKKFIELSKLHHPDYFATQGTEKQAESLDISASLNKGWKIFQNPDDTIRYVLQIKGMLEEEEKYQLPNSFLMQMMEINEQLADAQDEPAIDELRSSLENLQNDIYEPVKKIVEGYQEGITPPEELLPVKEYYFKKKYLNRIRQQLNGKA
jgi:molecular chaperone HscB